VAATRVLAVVGRQGAGKTMLIKALAAEFERRRLRVRTIAEAPDHAGQDPLILARQHVPDADIVLVEGFTAAHLPKVEVYRLAAGAQPLFGDAEGRPNDWVAMVTDNAAYRAPFPVFRFNDTAWLVTLGNIAWDRAKVLPPA
jgi:molybdopterin-guanine dinucleotide biosynthesis protein